MMSTTIPTETSTMPLPQRTGGFTRKGRRWARVSLKNPLCHQSPSKSLGLSHHQCYIFQNPIWRFLWLSDTTKSCGHTDLVDISAHPNCFPHRHLGNNSSGGWTQLRHASLECDCCSLSIRRVFTHGQSNNCQ